MRPRREERSWEAVGFVEETLHISHSRLTGREHNHAQALEIELTGVQHITQIEVRMGATKCAAFIGSSTSKRTCAARWATSALDNAVFTAVHVVSLPKSSAEPGEPCSVDGTFCQVARFCTNRCHSPFTRLSASPK
jgi:hypothetical protein